MYAENSWGARKSDAAQFKSMTPNYDMEAKMKLSPRRNSGLIPYDDESTRAGNRSNYGRSEGMGYGQDGYY